MAVFTKSSLIYYIILIVILLVGVYLYAQQALYFEQEELSRFDQGAKGYVSDEVWYVDAARNLLRKVFGLTPRLERPRATLVYSSNDALQKALNIAPGYGIKVFSNRFSKINAIYVEANSIELLEYFARETNATDIVYGWILGDAENINNYLNVESHPPTAKYLIALVMYLFGDRPFLWRIPSIAMGFLTILFSFLVTHEITKSYELALIVSALVAVDPLTKIMSSIALLDIFVAAMTLIAIYIALRDHLKEAVVFMGFASTFKFTALLAFIPLLFLYIRDIVRKYSSKFSFVFFESIGYLMLAILSFIFFQLLISIPIIIRLGLGEWLKQSIFIAISWHLSVKCTGPTCPIASTPWEWFFGINSFPIYVDPKQGSTIVAQGLVPAYVICFVLMFFTIPYRKIDNQSRTAWYLIIGLFLGYTLLWILGSRTQYSFYAVQLTPFIYIYLVIQIYEFLNRENIIIALRSWKEILEALWNAVLAIFK